MIRSYDDPREFYNLSINPIMLCRKHFIKTRLHINNGARESNYRTTNLFLRQHSVKELLLW